MDPLGLGFEHYDGVGAWRDEDAGRVVDAHGEITGTSDVNGTFDGALALAEKVSRSAQVRSCIVKELFRFAYGRSESDADACTLQALEKALTDGKGNLKALIVALTNADPFLFRGLEAAAP
jgi:hypothetical protein